MTSYPADPRRRLEEFRAALERAHGSAASAACAELREVLAALERVERGTYGRCQNCGGAIGRQRLLALPATRFCIACSVQ